MTTFTTLPHAHQSALAWLVNHAGTARPSDVSALHALEADGLAHHDADDDTWRLTDKGWAVWHGRENLRAALAGVLRCDVTELPEPPPYDEGLEARISHVAETWDAETQTSQPLRPRRDR